MLSCGCDFDGDCDWWWMPPDNFTPYKGKRRKRCRSCGELTEIGDEHVEVDRFRNPEWEIEESMYSDGVPLASYHYCERCGEILLALIAYGYCPDMTEDMRSQLREHWKLAGFTPPNSAQGLAGVGN